MRMPNFFLRSHSYKAPVSYSLPAALHRVEDAMCDASGPPPFHRLTNVTHFQVTEVRLSISACHGQVAQLADRIEGAVVVTAVCVVARAVLIGAQKFRRHAIFQPFPRA